MEDIPMGAHRNGDPGPWPEHCIDDSACTSSDLGEIRPGGKADARRVCSNAQALDGGRPPSSLSDEGDPRIDPYDQCRGLAALVT